MKRSGFKPGGGLSRKTGLGSGGPPKAEKKSGGAKKPPLSPFEIQREAARRAALNALKRARRSAEKAGVSLSEWEDEFLSSVGERVQEHGRAFADPEKGAPGQALSAMQGRKLKEITRKANGEDRFGARRPKSRTATDGGSDPDEG